eukprot:GHVU01065987.1.p1 GENE.GHVU01065987.1~~GHVU01065987.1.p1  ORF type:complete len:106 (+),score=4.09 GHVU01065987.1:406-723(+)
MGPLLCVTENHTLFAYKAYINKVKITYNQKFCLRFEVLAMCYHIPFVSYLDITNGEFVYQTFLGCLTSTICVCRLIIQIPKDSHIFASSFTLKYDCSIFLNYLIF